MPIKNKNPSGEEATETVKRNFCVDDMLKSMEKEDVTVKLARDVIGMSAKKEFKLTKFIRNSCTNFLAKIPEDRLHK